LEARRSLRRAALYESCAKLRQISELYANLE
jgi:hypothetical protein